MNLTRLAVMFVGLLFLDGVLAGTASATTVVECRMQVANLRNGTVEAQRQSAQTKDQSGSVAKLDDISLMLAEGKNAREAAVEAGFVRIRHVEGFQHGVPRVAPDEDIHAAAVSLFRSILSADVEHSHTNGRTAARPDSRAARLLPTPGL